MPADRPRPLRLIASLLPGAALGAALLAAAGDPGLQARTLRVGVSGNAPFVRPTDGDVTGFSVEVWRELALRNNLPYELVRQPDTAANLAALADGSVDVAIGPISITPERLETESIEFTHPYFLSEVGVLLNRRTPGLWLRLQPFFGLAVLSSLGLLLLSLLVVGTLIWLAEKGRNPQQFPADPARGVANGVWFALVTLTTVGYGDRSPVTNRGRVIAGTWMLVSLLALSSITAGLASAFTLSLSSLSPSGIETPDDLRNRPVAVVSGTTSEKWGRRIEAQVNAQPSLEEAVELLERGSVTAVIFDAPALQVLLRKQPHLPMELAPFSLASEPYGFGLEDDSELLRPLNISMLQLWRTGDLEELEAFWIR